MSDDSIGKGNKPTTTTVGKILIMHINGIGMEICFFVLPLLSLLLLSMLSVDFYKRGKQIKIIPITFLSSRIIIINVRSISLSHTD